jgi:hypothetical protein
MGDFEKPLHEMDIEFDCEKLNKNHGLYNELESDDVF